LYALRLDRASGRRVVACRGQLDGITARQRQNGLYRAFAEGLGAHDDGTVVVLQGTGDDLRGRSGAAIDQDHHGGALQQLAGGGIEILAITIVAALGVDDQPTIQEGIRNLHRSGQQAARVVA